MEDKLTMKTRKSGLMQRMMAVLLSAVLVVGMMWEAAPISVLAQESVSENTPEPVEGEIEPVEGEKEPAEETGSGEQEDPEKTEDEEKDPEGQEPGEGAEQEKPQPEDEKEKTPEPGKEEEKGTESVSDNDAPAESVSENDAVDENSDLQALLERIDALPDAEEYLAAEPDADSSEADEAAYEEWLAGLYAYAEEALDIQEAIEELSEEEQAKIPEEAFAKLAAWVEIAQTAGERAQVMAEEIESGSCGDNLTWTLENGVLTISGSGAMTDYEWRTKVGSSSPFSILAKQNKNITTVKFIADATGAATSIGNYAFWGCSKLTSIEIPKGVTSIGDDAFDHCTSLTKITIPESVESIAVNAFSACCNLETVTMQRKTPPTIGNKVFGSRNVGGSGCKFITDTDKAKGIHVPKGTADAYKEKWSDYADNIVDDVELDDNIASGDGWTLAQDGKLTITSNDGMTDWISWISKQDIPETYRAQVQSVEIKYGVTSIGASAFSGCSGLKKITIPDGVTNIGNSAFNGCSGLAEISIPNSVTSMGSAIFQDCSGLSKITIPENVTSIGSFAFIRCSSLTSITISENVTSIGMYAFQGCSGLTEVTIPKKVESIGTFGFQGCSKLTKVTMESETPPELDVVAFTGCPCVEDTTKGIYVPVGALEAYQGTVGKEKGWEPYKDHITDGTTSSETHEHDDVTFTAWTKTDSLPTDAGNYYLTENVTLSNTWNVPGGSMNNTTCLCLNGKTINAPAGTESVIRIGRGTLKLYDCQGAGNITGGQCGVNVVNSLCTFQMYSGRISGNNSSSYGGGVKVIGGGTFEMYGGEISGNRATDWGGGVYGKDTSTFSMYGGKIRGNRAGMGGGVFGQGTSTFSIYGGEISGNNATQLGGGVLMWDDSCTFTVGGNAVISGNECNGKKAMFILKTDRR